MKRKKNDERDVAKATLSDEEGSERVVMIQYTRGLTCFFYIVGLGVG